MIDPPPPQHPFAACQTATPGGRVGADCLTLIQTFKVAPFGPSANRSHGWSTQSTFARSLMSHKNQIHSVTNFCEATPGHTLWPVMWCVLIHVVCSPCCAVSCGCHVCGAVYDVCMLCV
eukprot:NODE_1630_length_888_cov_76.893921_g1274_i0.p2 GENE.NODE_1630_length_888_cov_76.893921_g1274_i0~~NODE_1630_length_888_cov_76.893921_g1274_i0.p2  ORF type:complete len:119 (+),score=17.02 NODE_1630_length_888_cov_76.893921_g1274_i0:114-470(+)